MYNDYSPMMPGGPGGVSISGKWTNKQTGEIIVVRDNIITEQGMQLMTNKGMISMAEFSKYYIQASDEMYDANGNVISDNAQPKEVTTISPPHQTDEPRPPMFDDDIINEEHGKQQQTEKHTMSTVVVQEQPTQPDNYTLIDKLFNKLSSKPTIELTVNWADFPKQELKTLIEYLDVEKKDIADYIYSKYADEEAIKFEVFKYLDSVL